MQGKKKKKKKAKAREFEGMEESEEGGEAGEARRSGGLPWEGSDRDYTHEELLGECLSFLSVGRVGEWEAEKALCLRWRS